MRRLALKIISDKSAYFRWVLSGFTEDAVEFQHSEAPCEFHSYDAALNDGLQALAEANAQSKGSGKGREMN
jgi:hypothetical protein